MQNIKVKTIVSLSFKQVTLKRKLFPDLRVKEL